MTGLMRTAMERLTALTRGAAAALALTAALMAPWTAPRAQAANPGRLNINVRVDGIALVTDLAAQTGGSNGSIDLTWTEPSRNGTNGPHFYEIRASSVANINTLTNLNQASLLSVFSPTVVPSPGLGGGAAGFVVTGLTPGVTYYFALRERDSSVPTPLSGIWRRGGVNNDNPNNFAAARFSPNNPDTITDLVAVASGTVGSPAAQLNWTAPLNTNGVPINRYVVKYTTFSAASIGNAETWFAQVTTTTIVTATKLPGQQEVFNITGLPTAVPIFFGMKAIDNQSFVSSVDTKSGGLLNQANVTLIATINVFASSGPVSGSVNLSWAEPSIVGFTPPVHYEVRVSSLANFNNNAEFQAALPLTALSQSAPPTPGAGGATVNFLVTGLTPAVTYFFGIREVGNDGGSSDWLRNVSLNLSATNYASASFTPNLPDPITDLTALAGGVEGQVSLSWTAPRNQNFVPMASYTVKYATFSVASLAGDTTAWFNAAGSSETIAAAAPGATVGVTLNGLFPLSTFYFGVRSADTFNEISLIDTRASGGSQAFVLPKNDPPGTPAGVSAVGGFRRGTVSWTDMTPAQKTVGFAFYRIYRSTQPTSGFVQVSSQTGTTYTERPLAAWTTFYYRVDASEGPGGLNGVVSSTVSAIPFTLSPQLPFGYSVAPSSAAITFSWAPTQRFSDSTPFDSTSTLSVDELQGYRIHRSSNICDANPPLISTMSVAVTTFSDVTNGDAYFYQVRGFNTYGASTGTFILTNLGDHNYITEPCGSRVQIDAGTSFQLNASSNSLGANILVTADRHPESVGGEVLQAVEFRAMLNGESELKGFYLPKPARISLRYSAGVGGGPVPDASPLGTAAYGTAAVGEGLGTAAGGTGAAAASAEHLGVYWHNGQEFKKLYGKVDTLNQTVTVESPNFGLYQIRTMARSASVVFDLSNISGRVITPNGDGRNDQVIFTYDPGPRNVTPEGGIYDLSGKFVAKMTAGLVPNTLVWDGTMGGARVSSGVYVYRITGDGKAFSGTVVVAR